MSCLVVVFKAMEENKFYKLIRDIKSCGVCENALPCAPRPVFQFSPDSRVLLIGQAPGIKAHTSGIPWDDKSGERLRLWLQVSEQEFYDSKRFAIVPMGLCYPGRGRSGDLPPRKECAPRWLDPIKNLLNQVQCEIYVGKYACDYYFGKNVKLTSLVKDQSLKDSNQIFLPHPSPRNNIWLAKNQWFEKDTLPKIRKRLMHLIN